MNLNRLSRIFLSSRKFRTSFRRIVWLIFFGFATSLMMIESLTQINEENLRNRSYPPTQSASPMLNRSQIVLAKKFLLEPNKFSCRPTFNKTFLYPLFIIVKTRAVTEGVFFQRRIFTRTSWAQEAQALNIPVVYALGRPNDSKVQSTIEEEYRKFGDLLQFDFIDSYYNITIKTTGILNWFSKRRCHLLTKHLLIADDDILINVPKIYEMIKRGDFREKILYGWRLADFEPHPTGRWAVSLTDYPNRTYPAFLAGAATIYPADLIGLIVKTIFSWADKNQPILFLDDIFITGIIGEQLGLERLPFPGLDQCSNTDLYSRSVISDCNNERRFYVWSKFILKRLGESTFHTDRLIDRTFYVPWEFSFKQTRNGTPVLHNNYSVLFDRTIFFDHRSAFSRIFLVIFVVIVVFLLLPKLVFYGKTKTTSDNSSCKPVSPKISSVERKD